MENKEKTNLAKKLFAKYCICYRARHIKYVVNSLSRHNAQPMVESSQKKH